MHEALKKAARPLGGNERDVFRQLFIHGPTQDGDLISKVGRDGLVERGLAVRNDGWQTLTEAGFVAAMAAGYSYDKDKWQNKRRSRP
jgi:hypothetical protein